MENASPPGLDEASVCHLYSRLEASLFNVVYRWVWNREEAYDLVQETFVRLWRMRARVRSETVEPLVYRIAVNLASNRRRRKKLWRWVSLEALGERAGTEANPEQQLEREQTRERVRRAIDALPEKYRRVLLLSELTDLTQARIAEALGIAPGTVGSRRHQALRLLERRLGAIAEAQEKVDDHLGTRPV